MRVGLVLLADGLLACLVYCLLHFGIAGVRESLQIALPMAVFVLVLVVLLVCKSKAVAIFLILLYQRFAPAHIRLRCVYTPSCSEYMRLSIEKYGLIKGVRRGWDRLKRCHYPNGGEDLP